jgi:hypothetical protein
VPNFDRDLDGTDDCYVLGSSTFPAMLSLIKVCDPALTDEEALAQTKKGYVEVIGEGVIWACSTNKNKCASDCATTDTFIIPGSLLKHCTVPALSAVDNCESVSAMYPVLIGRQYYATVAGVGVGGGLRTVTRFAQMNGEVLDQYAPLIQHCEDFETEAGSTDCAGTDAGSCFAYVAATTNSVAEGADDMNHCLYKSKILVANDVSNKFGAGATFGPTLVDIQTDNPRNGSLATTAAKIEYIMGYMNDAQYVYNGGGWSTWGDKQWADSHYFAVPAPGIYDISTSFAFIFPFQHFIGENNFINVATIYDMEEAKRTIDLPKFISPGLPTPTAPGEEAQLFKLNAPFSEGWLRFAVTATNSTTGCTESVVDTTSCEVSNVGTPTDPYVPAYSGAVFNYGAQHISASHFQYNNNLIANDID